MPHIDVYPNLWTDPNTMLLVIRVICVIYSYHRSPYSPVVRFWPLPHPGETWSRLPRWWSIPKIWSTHWGDWIPYDIYHLGGLTSEMKIPTQTSPAKPWNSAPQKCSKSAPLGTAAPRLHGRGCSSEDLHVILFLGLWKLAVLPSGND